MINIKQKPCVWFSGKLKKSKGYSLVDMIIRLMIEDVSLGNIYVMTFNEGDFYGIRNIEIINSIRL